MARGTIGKRGNSYYIRYYDLDGKQYWETIGPRKKDAEKALAERLKAINAGEFQKWEDITFGDFAKRWITAHRSRIRERTAISYEQHLTRFIPFFGRYKLRQITPEMVENFIAELENQGLSAATCAKHLRTLKTIFNRAVEWNYLSRNPAQFIKPPRVIQKEVDYLTPAELQTLIDACLPEHKALIMTAVLTGMRRGELLGLRWPDIDFNSNTIFVRVALYKGKLDELKSQHSRRKIPMPKVLVQELKTHQARLAVDLPSNELDLVFPNAAGKPMDGNNLVKRIFEPTLKRAGLRRIRFHDLRHSFASLLIAQNEPIKYIERVMGHSSIQVTMKNYAHLLPDAGEQAAKRLEELVFDRK